MHERCSENTTKISEKREKKKFPWINLAIPNRMYYNVKL